MKPTLRRAPREAGSRLFRTDEASAGDGEARAGVGGLGSVRSTFRALHIVLRGSCRRWERAEASDEADA
ncbi:hypothetical protein PHYSODRAFT_321330 [Phytophthora sojae]|uniref:Uncharacterized protein n=1 Tax=Phytophthora sojae (strain P6497) TaxID=1094619 RepID=G4YK26_PHYSP|nr:hypothetical protein PHYSODRAFT_321329 [Phytophthora sojae]XP_009514807.1 hypothetical protein PHYSODRAFT_321330 [Phytophthora sojae]EGZ27531.1 hypothetical protein PHYSODRAFT_321329 [Phytophthora sojae]EGZ27532.1 hypothetical protein PHYSODRAFT_321330 [Phytophthora sojae]|eukprot:XP_009514806.1 hypothetical protein PHYSODRAFT_321329 [Phytophthora sojae]